MKETHILFVGRNIEAAWNSFLNLKSKETVKVIGLYSEISKEAWKEVKRRIKKMSKAIKIEELKIDFNNILEIIQTISKLHNNENTIMINITGLSKEGLIGIMLYYASIGNHVRSRIAMLQGNGQIIDFPPYTIFQLGCDMRRRKTNLRKEILKTLEKNNGEMYLEKLTQKLKRAKPTIVESLKKMEWKGMIYRIREGRKVKIRMNKLVYDLMKIRSEVVK